MIKRILTGALLLMLALAVSAQGQTTGTRPGISQGYLTAKGIWYANDLDSVMYFPPDRPADADSTWVLTYGADGAIVWTHGAGGGYGYYEDSETSIDTTTDATVTDVVTIALAEQQTASVTAMTTARSTADDVASYVVEAAFYRNTGGNVTILGSSVITSSHYSATANWNFDIVADASNQTIDVRITGDNAKTIYWSTRVSYAIRGE